MLMMDKFLELQVITVIAQHPAGRSLHLNNLHWALSKFSPEIVVCTFDKYNFSSLRGERYVISIQQHDFQHLYDGKKLLEIFRTNPQVVLLIQQDILFPNQVDYINYENIVFETIAAKYTYPTSYSIVNSDYQLLYPRLWEGGIFYPTKFLRQAFNDGVGYGNCRDWHLAQPNELFNNMYFFPHHIPNLKLMPIKAEGFTENLVDLTTYAAIHKFPYTVVPNINLHFSGPEHTHRICPNIYNDPILLSNIFQSGVGRGDEINPLQAHSTALMYLLSEVWQLSPIVIELLLLQRNKYLFNLFKEQLRLLYRNAQEWMTPKQYNILEAVCAICHC